MSEYRPTEYVVDFGDCRSNRFVGLNMTLIKQNGAKLHERIVRCRDCVKFSEQEPNGEIGTCELGLEDTGLVSIVKPNGFCAWGERK